MYSPAAASVTSTLPLRSNEQNKLYYMLKAQVAAKKMYFGNNGLKVLLCPRMQMA